MAFLKTHNMNPNQDGSSPRQQGPMALNKVRKGGEGFPRGLEYLLIFPLQYSLLTGVMQAAHGLVRRTAFL